MGQGGVLGKHCLAVLLDAGPVALEWNEGTATVDIDSISVAEASLNMNCVKLQYGYAARRNARVRDRPPVQRRPHRPHNYTARAA